MVVVSAIQFYFSLSVCDRLEIKTKQNRTGCSPQRLDRAQLDARPPWPEALTQEHPAAQTRPSGLPPCSGPAVPGAAQPVPLSTSWP